MPPSALAPYDALLLLSFGGPEQPDDVVPFLENVTAGRGIPRTRLARVAEHYQHFGGRSPINDQNRALLRALRAELDARGLPPAVSWGNRNWAPYLADALREAHQDGARRVLTWVTSAYASYSGCRQYREDLATALATLAAERRSMRVDKVRHYFDHPGFLEPTVECVLRALASLPAEVRNGACLSFVTHSIPRPMEETSGPTGGSYTAQHRAVLRYVSAAVASRTGVCHPARLVFCSRSGPPGQPWLEPDVNDHLVALRDAGVPGVVLAPIGFVSDHMEVVFDLDTEARETAARLGLPMARAATVGVEPRFVAGLVDLALERAATERGEQPARAALSPLGPSHDVCPAGCCPNLRDERRAAVAGADGKPGVTE